MSEFELLAREWEAAEQSRHAELMKDLKREFRVEPRASAPVEQASEPSNSLRLPPVAERSQVKPNDRYGLSHRRNRYEPV